MKSEMHEGAFGTGSPGGGLPNGLDGAKEGTGPESLGTLTDLLVRCCTRDDPEAAVALLKGLRRSARAVPEEFLFTSVAVLADRYPSDTAVAPELASLELPAYSRSEIRRSLLATLDSGATTSAARFVALGIASAALEAARTLPSLRPFRRPKVSDLAHLLGAARLGSTLARDRLASRLFTSGGRWHRSLRPLVAEHPYLEEAFGEFPRAGRPSFLHRSWRIVMTHPRTSIAAAASLLAIGIWACKTPESVSVIPGTGAPPEPTSRPSDPTIEESLAAFLRAHPNAPHAFKDACMVFPRQDESLEVTRKVETLIASFLQGFKSPPKIRGFISADRMGEFSTVPVPGIGALDISDVREFLELPSGSRVLVVFLESTSPVEQRIAIYDLETADIPFMERGRAISELQLPSIDAYVVAGKRAADSRRLNEFKRYYRLAKARATDRTTKLGVEISYLRMAEDVDGKWFRELAVIVSPEAKALIASSAMQR